MLWWVKEGTFIKVPLYETVESWGRGPKVKSTCLALPQEQPLRNRTMQSFKTDSVAQRLCFNCSWSKFKHLLLVRLLFYLFTYLFIHLFLGWVEESSFRFPMAIKLGWRTEVWEFLKCKAAKMLLLARITCFFIPMKKHAEFFAFVHLYCNFQDCSQNSL